MPPALLNTSTKLHAYFFVFFLKPAVFVLYHFSVDIQHALFNFSSYNQTRRLKHVIQPRLSENVHLHGKNITDTINIDYYLGIRYRINNVETPFGSGPIWYISISNRAESSFWVWVILKTVNRITISIFNTHVSLYCGRFVRFVHDSSSLSFNRRCRSYNFTVANVARVQEKIPI